MHRGSFFCQKAIMVENPSQMNAPSINALAMAYLSASERSKGIEPPHNLAQEVKQLRLRQGIFLPTYPGLGAIGYYLNSDTDGDDEQRTKRQRRPPE